jgi:hypothetical protein
MLSGNEWDNDFPVGYRFSSVLAPIVGILICEIKTIQRYSFSHLYIMDFIYVFINGGGGEWEDMILFLSKEDAIQYSVQFPRGRVEIFCKIDTNGGFFPTYNFYQNGVYTENNKMNTEQKSF